MKFFNYIVGCLAITAIAAFFMSLNQAEAETQIHGSREAANFTRPCRFGGTNTQVVTATGSSAATAQLKGWTVYRVLCTTDTYFDQGDSAVTAASTDPRVMTGIELYILSLQDYVAFRAVSTAGQCDVTECR